MSALVEKSSTLVAASARDARATRGMAAAASAPVLKKRRRVTAVWARSVIRSSPVRWEWRTGRLARVAYATLTRAGGVARRSALPRLRDASVAAQARLESVAERVPEEIGPEDGEAYGHPGVDHEPGGLARVLRGGDRQHASPRGVRLGDAKAEEGQRRLGEDGATELGGDQHHERSERVGQHVAQGDPRVPRPERAGGLDVDELAD